MNSITKLVNIPTATPQASSLQEILTILRKRINTGKLAPGSRLQEQALAQEFGVSRVRIREVLLALQERHLVEREPNRSAIVAKLDLKHACEIFDVRESLEGLCVYLATQNRPPESWQRLFDMFHGPMQGYADTGEFALYLEGIDIFRQELLEAAGSSVLREMMDRIDDRSRVIINRTIMLPGRIQKGLAELQLVVAAMVRGDANEAARLRRANVRSQGEFLRRHHTFVL